MPGGSRPDRAASEGFSGEWRRWFPHWPAGTPDTGRELGADTFAAALADLVHTLQREGINDDGHALEMITRGAIGLIAGAEQGGIVVPAGGGRLDSRAGVGELAPLVLKLQNEVGQGPCVDAVTQAHQILIHDLPEDNRWPAFRDAVANWGLRSVLCTPLRVQHTTVGSLTLLSTRAHAFGDAAAGLAAVFAAHATLALTSLQQVRNLQAMAGSRHVIGRAEGMLIQRYGVSPDTAFGMLVRASQHSNIKLRVVCQHLVDTGELAP